MNLDLPSDLVRRLFGGLALAALVLWWVSVLDLPGAESSQRWAMVVLLTAPWTAVVTCLVVAWRRRLWLWATVAAALLLVGVASWAV